MIATTDPNYDGMAGRTDDIYEALLAAHNGLAEAESAALNARLILLLCNVIGDLETVFALISSARTYAKHV